MSTTRSLEGTVWKKDEEQPAPRQAVVAAVSTDAPRTPVGRPGHATIGPSIIIKGEVSGDEDLLIQGQVDGSVALDLHAVTVGGGGRVKANITGRIITIEGNVEGDLKAQEQIILRGSARVQGDLKAPRIVLEDGASFRGLVDMGAPREGVSGAEARGPDKGATVPPRPKTDAGAVKDPPAGVPRPAAKPRDPSGTGAGA